jgi:hypothetical protein
MAVYFISELWWQVCEALSRSLQDLCGLRLPCGREASLTWLHDLDCSFRTVSKQHTSIQLHHQWAMETEGHIELESHWRDAECCLVEVARLVIGGLIGLFVANERV